MQCDPLHGKASSMEVLHASRSPPALVQTSNVSEAYQMPLLRQLL